MKGLRDTKVTVGDNGVILVEFITVAEWASIVYHMESCIVSMSEMKYTEGKLSEQCLAREGAH